MINKGSVYERTGLGHEEISNAKDSILPREARTVLILLDGRKTYNDVANALKVRSMFSENGGVDPFMQVLLDLEFVSEKKVETTQAFRERVSQSAEVEVFTESASIQFLGKPEPSVSSPAASSTQRPTTQPLNTQPKQSALTPVLATSDVVPMSGANLEKLRSTVASIIERNTDGHESWGYMMQLEGKNTPHEIYALVEQMRGGDNKRLEKGLSKVSKTLKRAFG